MFNRSLSGEVGAVITKNNDLKKPEANSEGKIEEEFTVARLYVSKMKSEVKNLVHKSSLLETAQHDGVSKMETLEKELSESKLLIGQHEAKMRSLSETIKELEAKKRSMEEQMDSLTEEISAMKAAEQMHQVTSDKQQEEKQMKEALEKQIEQHREQHQKQVGNYDEYPYEMNKFREWDKVHTKSGGYRKNRQSSIVLRKPTNEVQIGRKRLFF